ncbi:MAG: class I SAM-dependent methyltransferase [Candidatus Cryptobacteroides sp.]
MADRYNNRRLYFDELAKTSKEYISAYIRSYKKLAPCSLVLEIGCGEGGNLVTFAEEGYQVFGIDISAGKIDNARRFFADSGLAGTFICCDFLKMDIATQSVKYDLIVMHDVIEHIEPEHKIKFLNKAKKLLKNDGVMMIAFPAWSMPFGGHQQICRHPLCRLPFIHLLPQSIYQAYLKSMGESPVCINELISIRRSGMSIESFEESCIKADCRIIDRTLWLINPHYKAKFGLTPRKLPGILLKNKWLRNHMSTSCFYICQ